MDVTQAASVRAAVDEVVRQAGRIDVLVRERGTAVAAAVCAPCVLLWRGARAGSIA
jgi:NAD(P)-dependent dehydrogenase (short-subunit alcohol dehydrogenase family)